MSRWSSAIAAVVLASLVGCGGGSGDGPVRVEASEYGYELPERLDGGLVTMELANTGEQVHEWILGRLGEGSSEAEVRAELLSGRVRRLRTAEAIAGVPAMTPGAELALTRRLEPGRYVLYCTMPAPTEKAHFQLGMIRFFDVEGVSDEEPPEVDGTITARADGFSVPAVSAGTHTLAIENAATEPRELKLLSLRPGMVARDLERWFANRFRGEPPADLLGILGRLEPGETAYVRMTFESGRRYHLFDDPNQLAARFDVD